MDYKKIAFPLMLVAVGFILAGDLVSFLPDPLKQASRQSRGFIVGLFPDWIQPTDRNLQRQQQIDELEEAPQSE